MDSNVYLFAVKINHQSELINAELILIFVVVFWGERGAITFTFYPVTFSLLREMFYNCIMHLFPACMIQ